jgi:DNA-binding transcriptional ArsR family regulator
MAISIATIFAALADPTRRRVVELLATGPMRAGELAAAAGVSAPLMSRHLRLLLEAGMIDDERSMADARVRLFFLDRASLGTLGEWLDQVRGIVGDREG